MYRFAMFCVIFAFTASGADDIANSFLSRKEEPLLSYKGNQRWEGQGFGTSGWVEASTEFSQDKGFSYTVLSSGGESRIVKRVLIQFLEAEKKADPTDVAFTKKNYDFESYDQHGLTMLKITPKRPETGLLNGMMFLGEDGDLVRVEGRPAKSPSPLIRDEKVVREYGRIMGIRVPLSMQSTARIFKSHTSLIVQYSYQEINGKPTQIAKAQ